MLGRLGRLVVGGVVAAVALDGGDRDTVADGDELAELGFRRLERLGKELLAVLLGDEGELSSPL